MLGTETKDRVNYTDGLLVGYRYYDTKNIAPQFPFGFGLSYAKFDFGPLMLTRTGNNVVGKLTVKNTSDRDGMETVQIYVHPLNLAPGQPVHQLKAFKKVAIPAGKSVPVEFTLPPSAFSVFDTNVTPNRWMYKPGKYEIEAAASSRDIRSKATLDWKPPGTR